MKCLNTFDFFRQKNFENIFYLRKIAHNLFKYRNCRFLYLCLYAFSYISVCNNGDVLINICITIECSSDSFYYFFRLMNVIISKYAFYIV